MAPHCCVTDVACRHHPIRSWVNGHARTAGQSYLADGRWPGAEAARRRADRRPRPDAPAHRWAADPVWAAGERSPRPDGGALDPRRVHMRLPCPDRESEIHHILELSPYYSPELVGVRSLNCRCSSEVPRTALRTPTPPCNYSSRERNDGVLPRNPRQARSSAEDQLSVSFTNHQVA